MTGVIVVDTNLTVLLVVGSASREYIAKHKRLDNYTVDDFELLVWIIAQFSEIILLPHILSEASTLVRQIGNPARGRIQETFRTLITSAPELPIQSASGASREEFPRLGLTDAVILHFCALRINGVPPTLVTVDANLANTAASWGYSVIDYMEMAR